MSDTQWAIKGECPECGGERLATDGESEWCMECFYSSESDSEPMNETQAEYDTYPDTFPQPLVQRYVSENGTDIQLVEDRPGGKEVAVVCSEYADLLGTAAGVAQEAKEMGYDPQQAVEMLPELLSLLESCSKALANDTYGWIALEHEVKDALDAAEGSDDA
jgi:hypothetical protein